MLTALLIGLVAHRRGGLRQFEVTSGQPHELRGGVAILTGAKLGKSCSWQAASVYIVRHDSLGLLHCDGVCMGKADAAHDGDNAPECSPIAELEG